MSLPSNPLDENVLPAPVAAPIPRDPPWNLLDVAMMMVVALAAMLLFGTAIGVGLSIAGIPVPQAMSPLLIKVVLGAQFLAYVVVLLFMYHLVTRYYRRGFSEAVRLRWPAGGAWIRYLLLGVGIAVLVQLASLVLPVPKSLPIDRYFQDRTSAYLMSLFGIAIAPLVEELFYRGFLYPALARHVGMVASVTLTAAAFALMHGSQLALAWAPLLILFFVGLAFTIARVLTGSVVPAIFLHVGYNASIFALIFFATDGFTNMNKLLQ